MLRPRPSPLISALLRADLYPGPIACSSQFVDLQTQTPRLLQSRREAKAVGSQAGCSAKSIPYVTQNNMTVFQERTRQVGA